MNVLNTEDVYVDAIISLIKLKELKDITVSDIVHYSGFSRQTFYSHFLDKYDLINYVYDKDVEYSRKIIGEDAKYIDIHIKNSLECMGDRLPFYIKALEYNGQNSLRGYIKTNIYQNHSGFISSQVGNSKLKGQLLKSVAFHTSSVSESIFDWLIYGCYISSQEITELIIDSIPSDIKNYYYFKSTIQH